jgi:hypothetical protein
MGGMHLPFSKKKTKPVVGYAAMELLKTFQNSTIATLQASVAFENFPTLHGNFPKHGGAYMATHAQKTKTALYWLDGDHY